MEAKECSHFTVATLGDSSVGKTTIIAKLSNPHGNIKTQQPTIAAIFRSHRTTVGDQNVVLEIWDTAGSERFRAVTKNYHRSAHVVLLVYSIDNIESYTNIDKWLDDVKENSPRPIIYLIGNKTDLIDRRLINASIAQKYAESNMLTFVELSAFTGDGIVELFDEIAARLVSQESPIKPNNKKADNSLVSLNESNPGPSNWCCY